MQHIEISSLEEAAFRSWPAEETHALDRWVLRATRGVTRRANSVYTSGGLSGGTSLEDLIDAAEGFYQERSLVPRFQLSPSCAPPELDARLAARGYRVEAEVAILVARADSLAAVPFDDRVRLEPALTDDWLEVSARQGRFRESEAVYRALLDRLGARARFALGVLDGRPSAVGLGVRDRAWFGIFSMLTVAPARRQALATGVLAALAREGERCGTPSLYLQVERENLPALALYAKLGFVERYRYYYRTRDDRR